MNAIKRTIAFGIITVAVPVAVSAQSVRDPASQRRTHAPKLVYSVVVPEEVPEQLELRNKDGELVYRKNGRREYVHFHLDGWEEYLDAFRNNQVGAVNGKQVELFDPRARPRARQEWGFTQSARMDGFRQCQVQLQNVIKQFGEERVRTALMPRPELAKTPK